VHPHADGVRPGPAEQFHVAAVREVRRVSRAARPGRTCPARRPPGRPGAGCRR
jgi:hypothetical protein